MEFSRKGAHLKNIRHLSIVTLCLILVSCTSGTSAPVTTVPPLESATQEAPEPEVQVGLPSSEITEDIIIDEAKPNAWKNIEAAADDTVYQHAQLLVAAESLVYERRNQESQEILGLIDVTQLSHSERVNLDILRARLNQAEGEHRSAVRDLGRLQRSGLTNLDQSVRIARLRAYSYSQLKEPVNMASELVQLYGLLSEDRTQQLEAGHLLWAVLSRMTLEELRDALQKTEDPIARQWYVLALALGLNSVRSDPFEYEQALNNWQQNNPEHPANELIGAGLAPGPVVSSRIALLLPLSSVNRAFVQAMLDGFMAQHAADTNPLKPQIDVIDIGDQPANVTHFYYQAVDNGADFVIGPLGVGFVNEITQYVDFIVPTLLLGETSTAGLPDYVYQFALAPEHEGVGVANRAWQDGHVTALVIRSPQQWSERAFSAFSDSWKKRGGHVIQVYDFELNQSDYSEAAKQILLIDASANRYQTIRAMMGESMKFVPRRRQDADFIYLSADSEHGRLLKPYLDFLKAHDLPIYATSHVYPGKINKIRDQDLNGIRFADMDWIIDKSERMTELKSTLEAGLSVDERVNRLFAMGVDIYNLVSRIEVLSFDPAARFHGVTSIIHLAENGRVLRQPRWAVFENGTPELIPDMAPPELGPIPKLKAGVVQATIREGRE
ncbi:MAG: ABC transporter substrate-binding protein [Gammaproteobacteria bacterium]|nr:ABC transporter substrate-binding protein [Gammaproteobacteria bacterium]